MGGFHGTGSSVSCIVPSFDSMHFHYYLTAGSGPVPVVQLVSETDRVDLRERERERSVSRSSLPQSVSLSALY